MKNTKEIRIRVNGLWSEWVVADALKLPEDIEAIEISEKMTVREVKKHFADRPNMLKEFNKIII